MNISLIQDAEECSFKLYAHKHKIIYDQNFKKVMCNKVL